MTRLALLAAFAVTVPGLAVASATVTAVEDLRRNSVVTVQGTVDRITDEDEFVLRDATGTVPIYIGPNLVPAPEGEAVTVTGVVDDGLRLEIYARELVRADGTRVTFSHSY
jgi:uncharacterized protein YdeI (BOF family)